MSAAIDLSRGPSMFGQRPSPQLRGVPSPGKRTRPFDPIRALEEIEDANAERMNAMSTWRSVLNLTMPDRQVLDGPTRGTKNIPQELFDSYGLRAMRRGQGNLIGAMTPPEQRWCEIVGGSGLADRQRERIAKGLEQVTKTFFDYLTKSRFATEAHTMAGDLMVSTGFMTIDKGTRERPLRVQAVPLHQCYPVEGPDGDIENMHRKYPCRPAQLERAWPGLQLSDRLSKMAKARPLERVEICESTTKEDGRGFRFTIFDPHDKSVLYDVQPTHPREPSRWITPRLYKRAQEVFGVGPGIEALPELRKLNKLQEITLKAGARFYQPPLLVHALAGLNPHTMRLSPNSVGMVNGQAIGNQPPFWSLPANGVPQWGNLQISDMRSLIDDIMFAREVVGPTEDMKNVTAYAISVRRQQLLLQQGVDLGRVLREFPFAVVRRGVWVLSQLGLIDPPIDIDDLIFSLNYLGPLAQAQQAEQARNMLEFVSTVRNVAGDQIASLGIKMEDVPSIAGRLWPGVEESMLRDEDEREHLQKQAAAVAALQAAGQAPQLNQTALPGVAA